MKNTRTSCSTAAISAMAVAITLLIGTGLSEAQKSSPIVRAVGTMRTPVVSVQSYGGNIRQMSPGPALSHATAPRTTSISRLPRNRVIRASTLPLKRLQEVSVAETILGSPGVVDTSSSNTPGFFDNASMTGIGGLKYRKGDSGPHEGTTPDAESYPNALKAAVSIPDGSSPGINELTALIDVRQTLELDRVIASMEAHNVPAASGKPGGSYPNPDDPRPRPDLPRITIDPPSPDSSGTLMPEHIREIIFENPRVADPSVVNLKDAHELKRIIDDVLNIPGDWDKEGDRNIYTSPRGGEPGFTQVDDPDDTPHPPYDPATGSQKDLMVELLGPGGATPSDGPPVDDQNPGYSPGDGFKLGPPETVDGSGDDDGSSSSTKKDSQGGKADGKAGSKSDSNTKEAGVTKEAQEKDKGTSDDPEGGDSPDESWGRAGIAAGATSEIQRIGNDSRLDTSSHGHVYQPSGGGGKTLPDPLGPAASPFAAAASSGAVKADKSGQAGWYDPENPPPPGPEFSPAADSRALTGGAVMNTDTGQAMYTDPDRPPDPDNPPRPNVSPTMTTTGSALGNQTDRAASPVDAQNYIPGAFEH